MTILDSSEYAISMDFNWISIPILLLIGIGIFIALYDGWDWSMDASLGIAAITVIVLFFLYLVFCPAKELETRYKVLLNDEISITEFLEDYEILKQEGLILTVREKEETK